MERLRADKELAIRQLTQEKDVARSQFETLIDQQSANIKQNENLISDFRSQNLELRTILSKKVDVED
jgi:hypothetical protein